MSIEFSANLSALRRDRGLSQKQAAEELGISQALLSHYEKGIRECNLDFVKKVAEYYDVTADYLLGMTDSRQRVSDILDPQTLASDRQSQPKTVLRHLFYLSRLAESEEESAQVFFTDFFTLCIKKYLSVTDGSDGLLSPLCDVSLNRLCENAPAVPAAAEPPLFTETLRDHALLLINNDIARALQ